MGLDNPTHIAFLLILLLLVFGAKRLPEIGRSLGSGMRGFKESLSGEASQLGLPGAGDSAQKATASDTQTSLPNSQALAPTTSSK
jgi:sec-independent protein translocase protein TatA